MMIIMPNLCRMPAPTWRPSILSRYAFDFPEVAGETATFEKPSILSVKARSNKEPSRRLHTVMSVSMMGSNVPEIPQEQKITENMSMHSWQKARR